MKRKLIVINFLLLLAVSLAMTLFHPSISHADTPPLTNDDVKNGALTWKDRAHIQGKFGSATVDFFDRDITDASAIGDHKFNYQSTNYDCKGSATIDLGSSQNSTGQWVPDLRTGHLHMKIIPPNVVNADCQSTSPSEIQLPIAGSPSSDTAGCPGSGVAGPPSPNACGNAPANIMYAWTDDNTIANVDGDSTWVFTKTSFDPNIFLQKGNNNACPNLIVVSGSTYKAYELTSNNTGRPVDQNALHLRQQCYQKWDDKTYTSMGAGLYPNTDYLLGDIRQNSGNGGVSVGNSNGTGAAAPDSCASLNTAISWIACPLIRAMDGAVSALDTAITSQLQTKDPNQLSPNLKVVWGRLRNIALIVLIPIMLIMVFGTAAGVGALDAYTVKRAMPRLLIAILFISLSWYITAFLINLTNVIAAGIFGIMTTPFGVANKTLKDFITVPAGTTISYGFLIFGGLFALSRADLAIIASFVGVGALALFTAFLTLVVRQILILALILLAPLAILSWIFPNNDDLWKLWWGTFSKLLLMYPLIVILIATGRIAASIIPVQQGSQSLFTNILVLLAYVLPYFLIPATFRYAGGVLANLAGIVNDRTRGFFDKQREFRGKHREELKKRSSAGGRFDPRWQQSNSRLIRGFNKLANRAGEYSSSPYKAAAYYNRDRSIPFLSRKGQLIAAQVEHEQWEQSMKYFQQLNGAIGSNDKAYRMLGGLHDGLTQGTVDQLKDAGLYGKALTTQDQVTRAANILASSESHTEVEAASALRRAAPIIGNKWNDPEMNYASIAAASAIGLAAHGFHEDRDMKQMGQRITAETGNSEFADSALVQVELAGVRSNPWLKAGYGHQYDPNTGEFLDIKEANRDIAVMGTLGALDVAGAKGTAWNQRLDTYQEIIDAAGPSAALLQFEVDDAKASIERRQAAMVREEADTIIARNPTISNELAERQARGRAQAREATDAELIAGKARLVNATQEFTAAQQGQTRGGQAERDIKAMVDATSTQLRTENPEYTAAEAEKRAKEIVEADPRNRELVRLRDAYKIGDHVKQTHLFSVASRYSTSVSADNKRIIMDIINKPGNEELKREFEIFEGRAQTDPAIRAMIDQANQGAIQAQQQAQQQQTPGQQPPPTNP